MKIRIITMEDPLYTVDFIKEIIAAKHESITGLTIAEGGRLKTGKKTPKVVYLLTLLLIMGPVFFLKNVWKTLSYHVKKRAAAYFSIVASPGLEAYAAYFKIPVDYTENPNSLEYLGKITNEGPDIIINQSQFIIKKPLLEAAKIGILNRHNALLPKNRGRLTPFWVLYKKETETGVSIHFLDEGIDSGEIIVQKRFEISNKDNFRSIIEKNYQIAGKAMIEAIDLLEQGFSDFLPNHDHEASYNSVPSLRDAFKYRFGQIRADSDGFGKIRAGSDKFGRQW